MKVLIVHPSFWISGGAEKVITRFANYLTDHHHLTTILTTEMCDDVKKELKDARLLICESMQNWIFMFNSIYKDFDVINLYNDPSELLMFGKHRPNVWYCNEPPTKEMGQREMKGGDREAVKNFINKVIVADEFNQKRFEKMFGIKPEIVPYGIDYDIFANAKPTDKYGLKDKFVITQVGFLAPTKNQLETVKVFAEVKKTIPNAKLVLVGHDKLAYADDVKKEIATLDISDDVVITGFIPQEEVASLYKSSDVVLMPIRSQGGWLSVFEAMASGTPVIISEEHTASSILKKNNLGYVGNYVDNILKVKSECDTIKKKYVMDQRWVKENLTWEKYAKGLLKAFEEVIK